MIARLSAELKRSLAWDQGKEMAGHAQFTVDTGLAVFFCDLHSPWQRGSNENTNGLLRQYWPKCADLRSLTQDDCDTVALKLNTQPRETLKWQTPAQALDDSYLQQPVETADAFVAGIRQYDRDPIWAANVSCVWKVCAISGSPDVRLGGTRSGKQNAQRTRH